MNLQHRLMRIFFHLLYHAFAFAYDFVAFNVSFGQWREWGKSIIPLIGGTRILELGHGPGHLQRRLAELGRSPLGLDESRQMGRIARKRLGPAPNLVRGLAQHIPLADASMDCVFATFPTEYIFSPQTIAEVQRCLVNDGRLIILPAAWPKNRFLTFLYRITGESPEWNETILKRFEKPFNEAGFETEVQTIELQSATLIFIIAKKR